MSSRAGPDLSEEVVLRALRTRAEYEQCVELQRETWGHDFTEVVPPSILLVSQKMGGVAAGAFDAQGRLLGFVFGISGLRYGRLAHWSDMLAVRREARGAGLGRRLKLYQRERLLELEIEVVYWTYDPLVARNAHLNINRLGARPVEYVPNMYGTETGSPLHGELGTDRFVVEWILNHERVRRALRGEPPLRSELLRDAPVINVDAAGSPVRPRREEMRDVQIAIPAEIERVKAESSERARAWRESTRAAFLEYLERGYRIAAFRRLEDGLCFYGLSSPDPSGSPD